MKTNLNIVVVVLLTVFLLSSCASYYQKSYKFNEQFTVGNLEEAQKFLISQKKAAEKKDRLLYFLDRGVIEQMLGNYEVSNEYFEKAYIYTQDYRLNISYDILSSIANPMLKPYKAEDFEVVLIHFYKAINYLQLNQLDEALVEVKRVNISLNELNDRYEDKKNRYKEDAFAHSLMGIIYEAQKDYNNAFIAYRNALTIYDSNYQENFQTIAPQQLQIDLLRMAKYNGFRKELDRYEKEFGFTYRAEEKGNGDLVFFWLNGLGPVKGEFSINFARDESGGGFVFANENAGYSFPIPVNTSNDKLGESDLNQVRFVRMAIPKYRMRSPLVSEAYIEVGNQKLNLEKAEDIGEIAISTLEDRMLREMGKSIARLVLKQASELAISSKNEDLGFLVSALNAVTEKADTRNWQSLPNSIYYQRRSLKEGAHDVKLVTKGNNISTDTLNFNVKIVEGKTTFRTYHSLESTVPYEQ
ncbi:MAG: hypothetical protein JKY48_18210 [Flavobacteriales bacterium]|nr:hypothetical protein [Flavobacteriales bacterium]